MGKIRIVTDSTADIPADVRQQLDIEVVPLKVHFDSEAFLDGVTITSEQFIDKLVSSASLPTTSQPSPVEFLDVYSRLGAEPDTHIISIHLSSALSGTYQSAVLAKSMYEGAAEITVVDSKSACYGIGLLAAAAARAAQEGRTAEEIERLVQTLRSDTRIYFLVDTLQYLQKGGRIGKAAAVVGSLLNIKPILSIDDDGQVNSVDKVRGQKKAMGRIVELLKAEFGDARLHLTVAHANAREQAEVLGGMVKEALQVEIMQYTALGPVIATHAGPGTVAVFVNRMEAYA